MSAKKFISELDRRKLLSERMMAKLRASVAEIRKPLSADALANFLVQKKLISKAQANEVLSELTLSGVDLAEEDADRSVSDDDAENSSVFSSHIIAGPAAGYEASKSPASGEEEIGLAPIDEEEEVRLVPIDQGPGSVKQKSSAELEAEDDFAVLEGEPDLDPLSPVEVLPSESRRNLSDRLVEEESTGGGLLDESFGSNAQEGAFDVQPAAAPTAKQKAAVRRIAKKRKPTKGQKRWDSPIILFGGGSLAVLLLAGGTIWFLLFRQSGDQILTLARDAMKSGAYAQAIDQFQVFLTSYPRHPEHSLARVQLAMVRIRQPTEANDFAQALTAAETELKAIEDDSAFDSSHDESAALLPQIAEGLARQAERAPPTSDDSKKLVALSKKALELCDNASYIPKGLRNETKLANVRDALERVERQQQSQLALGEGVKAMEAAIAAGKPIESYAAHAKLLKEHPELAGEKPLQEVLNKAAAAEQAAMHFVAEPKAAETTDRPTPWVAALAVANRRVIAKAPAASGTACVRVDGAVYGLDAATGGLLWRRYVGYKSSGWPIPVGGNVILADTTRHELLRLDAASGKLLWRQSIGEPFAEPLIVGDRGYVPADSGRLYVLDLKSGARTGYLQCPQPLHVTPAIDRTKTHLYLAGDRASLYSFSLPDLKCAGVHFLGYAPGTIQVAPVVVMDKVAVVENNGVETSQLHLFTVDNKGAITKEQAKRRLNGLVTSPPLTTGRGLIVVTDRGQIEVYDIAAGNGGEALSPVAARDPTSSQPITRYFAVIGRSIWLADTQLTKYNIVPTGSRLPVEEIENNHSGATFNHPLQAIGETLIEVYRPKGRAGVVIAALDSKQGHVLWATDLAMPPAGAPVVDDAARTLTVANSAGYAFRFDEATIRSRVQDQPLAPPLAPPQPPMLDASLNLGQGRAAFYAAGSDWLLLYNPADSASAKWLQLVSPLACGLTQLGNGFLAPLKVGQVFYLNAADGARLATPFQPRISTQSSLSYKPAGDIGADGRQFVITDGAKKIYLVSVVDQPQPHLEAIKEGDIGPRPISTPVVVLGDTALAVAGDSRLVRFKVPSLESAGESDLPAPAEWGPFQVGNAVLLATVDQKLLALAASGEIRWQVPLERGQFAGPPLVLPDSVLLAYRNGFLERRALADGKLLAKANVEQPLATGPVLFLQKIVVAANDGTIIVVNQP